MKKRISVLMTVCLFLSCSLASCSGSGKSSVSGGSEKEKQVFHEEIPYETETGAPAVKEYKEADADKSGGDADSDENDSGYIPEKPIGGDITGNWEITDEGTGELITLMFEADGGGSVYIDATKYLFFNKEGNLCVYGMDIGDNTVQFDGKTMTVTLSTDLLGDEIEKLTEDATLMILEKTEPGGSSELDGEYRFAGGVLGTAFADRLSDFTGGRELPVYARISGEDFGLKLDRLFTWSADGDTLTVSGTGSILGGADGDISYSVSGDKLILYYPLGGTSILTRSKLK